MPTAGKTGTTNSSKEAWFVGYTPYYVGATYIADDAGVRDAEGKIVKTRNIGGGSTSSALLWKNIMSRIHKNLEKKDFDKPEGIYFTKINLQDGGTSSYGSNAAFIDGTSASRVTTAPSEEKKDNESTAAENQNNSSGNLETLAEITSGNSGNSNNNNNSNNNSGGNNQPPESNNGDNVGNTPPPDNGGDTGQDEQ